MNQPSTKDPLLLYTKKSQTFRPKLDRHEGNLRYNARHTTFQQTGRQMVPAHRHRHHHHHRHQQQQQKDRNKQSNRPHKAQVETDKTQEKNSADEKTKTPTESFVRSPSARFSPAYALGRNTFVSTQKQANSKTAKPTNMPPLKAERASERKTKHAPRRLLCCARALRAFRMRANRQQITLHQNTHHGVHPQEIIQPIASLK